MGIAGDWDRRISRRTLLKTGGSLTAGLALSGGLSGRALAARSDGNPFALGVASGDPTPDGVVLWTRLAPDPLVPGGGMAQRTYSVRYEVATDEGFRHVVRRGSAPAFASEAHSARVELERLQPGTEYFYRFRVGRDESPVGRTRTAPPPGSAVGELRFAFASCQNFPVGYFNSYADIAAQDLDLVVHLGDYIYEGPAAGPLRAHAPAAEIVSLDDYRVRHGQYKTDLDLQAAHAALPWLVTWDDHEVENNYADEEADPNVPPEEFARRRAAAYQAYWEHMPLSRSRKPRGPDLQLTGASTGARWRRSTRSTRASTAPTSRPPARRRSATRAATARARWTPRARSSAPSSATGCSPSWRRRGRAGMCSRSRRRSRRTTATRARAARSARATTGTATWRSASGCSTGSSSTGRRTRSSSRATRTRTGCATCRRTRTSTTRRRSRRSSWARRSRRAATRRRRTTSYGDDPQNPHIVFRNNNRGYVRCTVTPEAWTSEYRIVSTVLQRGAPASTLASFVVEDGRPGGQRAT